MEKVFFLKHLKYFNLKKMEKIMWKTFLYLLITAGAIVFILPFIWMVSTSLKPASEIFVFPPKWIPSSPKFQNYISGWTTIPFNTFLKNTVIVTAFCVVGEALVSSWIAFAFACLRCRMREILFIMCITTMMIPYQVLIIPLYILFQSIGWIDTLKPLIVPKWFGTPFYIFLLRQYYKTVPIQLKEAAQLDGCSSWRIYWTIYLPLSKPAIAAVVIFSFFLNWNDFIFPLIYLSSMEKYTLTLGLALFKGQYFTEINLLMAVSVLTVLPIIVIFFFMQKFFIRGITLSGLKG
ncbi:MAG: carbohydrate ABC transporter permease [Candidatus Baldrarchaeia archaeon]